MRRGKHAAKHIRVDRYAPSMNISRVKVNSVCQVVTVRGRICGDRAIFTGVSVRPTNPPTPKHEIDLCRNHAVVMRDNYGYNVNLKQGEYALLP